MLTKAEQASRKPFYPASRVPRPEFPNTASVVLTAVSAVALVAPCNGSAGQLRHLQEAKSNGKTVKISLQR